MHTSYHEPQGTITNYTLKYGIIRIILDGVGNAQDFRGAKNKSGGLGVVGSNPAAPTN